MILSKISYILIFVLFVSLGFGYYELNQMLERHSEEFDQVKCIFDSDKLVVDSSSALKLAEKDLTTEYSFEKYSNVLNALDGIQTRKSQFGSECNSTVDLSLIDSNELKEYLSDSKSTQTSESINKLAENLQQERLNIFTKYDLLVKKY